MPFAHGLMHAACSLILILHINWCVDALRFIYSIFISGMAGRTAEWCVIRIDNAIKYRALMSVMVIIKCNRIKNTQIHPVAMFISRWRRLLFIIFASPCRRRMIFNDLRGPANMVNQFKLGPAYIDNWCCLGLKVFG